MIESIINIDKKIFLALNGLHSPFFDNIMWLISHKYTWIPFYIVLLFILWRKFKNHTLIILFFVGLLVALTDLVSVHAFKNVFMRFRPTHDSSIQDIVHTVNNYFGGKYGFVSSHAANSFGLAMFLTFFFKNTHKKLVWILWIWAIIVSYSRIYLGVHFPGDVICGGLVGVTLACIVFLLYKLYSKTVCRKFNSENFIK